MEILSKQLPSSLRDVPTGGGLLEKQVAGTRGNSLGDAMATLKEVELKLVKTASVAAPEGPLANAGEVSRLLREKALEEVPPAFIFPEQTRATVPHDDFCDDQDIPTIDISPVFTKDSKELEYLVEEIARACESPGFFHVVRHGVPEQLVKDAQSHAAKLFDLPLDQKLQGSFAAGATKQRRGYNSTPKTFTPSPALIWQEGFTLIGDKSGQVDVDSYAEKIWPHDEQQRESFCQVYREYGGHSMRLALILKDLVIRALKVDPKHFEQYFENLTQVLHLTWYPSAPNPMEVMGLNPHYDVGFFTLIAQDEVPGLQLRGKDGKWFSIRPVPGAFCFNVADSLEALSNGRFKGNLHRVVVNKEKPRLSITTFFVVAFDKMINPPPELIDDAHPRLYRPFTLGEYMTSIRQAAVDYICNCGHLLDFVTVDSSTV